NATGAGDAFTAALAWALMHGVGELEACARAGLAAASLAVESRETVNPEISQAALERRLEALNA
ncbi:MAG: MarR family transcriptional regulator, partial [Clostridia bacterium]|nr:MarR family transcriptional regulator [Clostridia bacterium]